MSDEIERHVGDVPRRQEAQRLIALAHDMLDTHLDQLARDYLDHALRALASGRGHIRQADPLR